MNKRISIITINYNDRTGLEKTIKSVLRQTADNFEFIVVDGNSTDGSKEIISTHKDKFTHIISEPDSGIYNAMNKGIKLASGTYLLFLNSGDTFSGIEVLEKAAQQLDDSYGIIYGDSHYIEENNATIRHYPEKLSFQFFLAHNLSHQSTFIRKELFNSIFFYNENYKIVSDWEFFIYAICKENIPYKHLDMVICNYDTNGISSIIDNHKLMHKEREQTIEKYFPLFIDDYKGIMELSAKRIIQYLYIKENPLAFKLLKFFMTLIIAFLPKNSKNI